MIVVIVIVVILVLLLLYVFSQYNGLVRLRNRVEAAWAQIDVQLKRRWDLIPNLVETVKGYASHEQRTFETVTAARAQAMSVRGSAAAQSPAENNLVDGVRQLLAVSEAYPQLRASYHFLQLQDELVMTENRIQAARRFFNGNVRDYNRRVDSFPSLVIARSFHFSREEYFEVEPIVRDVPAVVFNPQ